MTAMPLKSRMMATRLIGINFDPLFIMPAGCGGKVWQNLICTFGLFSKIEKSNPDFARSKLWKKGI
jgi:hypothetical protein